ncbi:MAG: hypothetical protein II877_13330 [Synergistaceae bacterium]|nr:hypothetical protein [Synergistaceae bacterium]MBQ7168444.1 hypothetical protein [Synergistaceae bacterium]
MMTSTDREILIEISGRLVRIEQRLDRVETGQGVLQANQVELSHRLDVIEARFDMLLWAVTLGMGLLAVLVTYMGLRQPKSESQPQPEGDRISLGGMKDLMNFLRGYDSSKPM